MHEYNHTHTLPLTHTRTHVRARSLLQVVEFYQDEGCSASDPNTGHAKRILKNDECYNVYGYGGGEASYKLNVTAVQIFSGYGCDPTKVEDELPTAGQCHKESQESSFYMKVGGSLEKIKRVPVS